MFDDSVDVPHVEGDMGKSHIARPSIDNRAVVGTSILIKLHNMVGPATEAISTSAPGTPVMGWIDVGSRPARFVREVGSPSRERATARLRSATVKLV